MLLSVKHSYVSPFTHRGKLAVHGRPSDGFGWTTAQCTNCKLDSAAAHQKDSKRWGFHQRADGYGGQGHAIAVLDVPATHRPGKNRCESAIGRSLGRLCAPNAMQPFHFRAQQKCDDRWASGLDSGETRTCHYGNNVPDFAFAAATSAATDAAGIQVVPEIALLRLCPDCTFNAETSVELVARLLFTSPSRKPSAAMAVAAPFTPGRAGCARAFGTPVRR